MKITAILVESLDGLITQGSNPNIYNWTSLEDTQQFFIKIAAANLIIMGSQTYLTAKSKIISKPGTLRIVLTSQPEKFVTETVPHQLEFINLTPEKLVLELENRGYSSALLVGGSTTLTSFLNANLVSELKITLEPIMLGSGKPLAQKLITEKKLKLKNWQKLNIQGTLILNYIVV